MMVHTTKPHQLGHCISMPSAWSLMSGPNVEPVGQIMFDTGSGLNITGAFSPELSSDINDRCRSLPPPRALKFPVDWQPSPDPGDDSGFGWVITVGDTFLIKISPVMRLSRKFVSEIQAIIEACYQGLMVSNTTPSEPLIKGQHICQWLDILRLMTGPWGWRWLAVRVME